MVQIPGPRYSVAPRNQDDSDIILWESNGLVSDRLVFVHIPKTGYVTEHLKELLTCNVLWDIWYKIFFTYFAVSVGFRLLWYCLWISFSQQPHLPGLDIMFQNHVSGTCYIVLD